jgi:hypothetical protein
MPLGKHSQPFATAVRKLVDCLIQELSICGLTFRGTVTRFSPVGGHQNAQALPVVRYIDVSSGPRAISKSKY